MTTNSIGRLFADILQQQKALERLTRSQSANIVGTYSSYNATTGNHTVLVRQGTIDRPIRTRLTTNAGLAAGDRVAVSQGRSINWAKAMPR